MLRQVETLKWYLPPALHGTEEYIKWQAQGHVTLAKFAYIDKDTKTNGCK